MNSTQFSRHNINQVLKITIFAVAFAFVETAVVVYLRHLLGSTQLTINRDETLFLVPGVAFLEPETAIKIIADSALLNVERIREGATLIMLAAMSTLTASGIRQKIAYFFLAFGIWDIFYYVFLKLTIGWPESLTDLDVFFMLPTPLVGPVYIPLFFSAILIVGSLLYLSKSK